MGGTSHLPLARPSLDVQKSLAIDLPFSFRYCFRKQPGAKGTENVTAVTGKLFHCPKSIFPLRHGPLAQDLTRAK
jgi:hypothetical protein